ncbi:exodeoxyribonuclease VII large subunit [Flaviflexus ciconiae]|uniref:exodeoxyribonuclease VII large subunit n=1 Tax=Flaviflexus ciconiae TaxID=2496867 RepID=UPI001D18903D|nr:exodeoxyribonuclease VII large subunit [Flaviflexus ciconiae]
MSSQVVIPSDLPQLAAETTADRPWPLALLSAKISEYVARMSAMWVEGEVLQYTPRGSSRVQFFTLRDLEEQVSVNCKAWTNVVPDEFAEGSRVVLRVKPDYWVGNGSLSLQVAEIRFAGVGDLLARLEALRKKLASEGLFSPTRSFRSRSCPGVSGLFVGQTQRRRTTSSSTLRHGGPKSTLRSAR